MQGKGLVVLLIIGLMFILPWMLTYFAALMCPSNSEKKDVVDGRVKNLRGGSRYTLHSPIRINSDAEFTAANGVVSGNGTAATPYLIEGWVINGNGYGYCIYIGNTTKYFVVRNCYVHNAIGNSGEYYWNSGIVLYNSRNGSIINNTVSANSRDGIRLESSSNNYIANNNASYNTGSGIALPFSSDYNIITANIVCGNFQEGIWIDWGSDFNTITANTISNNYRNGTYIGLSNDNIITFNRICNNSKYGVFIDWTSSGNTIHHNNFINNSGGGTNCQAYDSVGSNSRHSLTPQEGNYWGNWNGQNWGTASAYPLDGGSVASDWYPLSSSVKIPPFAFFSANLSNGIVPLEVSFTSVTSDQDGTIVSYCWDFGDRNISTQQNPSHTFTKARNYTIILTVTDNDGLNSSAIMTITIYSSPPIANFTVNITNGTAPLHISFTSTSYDLDGIISSYLWDFGDGNTSTQQNPNHTYAVPGNYSVILTVKDNDGGMSFFEVIVTVLPPTIQNKTPSMPLNVTASCNGDEVLIQWQPPLFNGSSEIIFYKIFYGNRRGEYSAYMTTTHTSYIFYDLVAGSKYYFAISAVNSVGEGDLSNETSILLPLLQGTENSGYRLRLIILILAIAFLCLIFLTIVWIRFQNKKKNQNEKKNISAGPCSVSDNVFPESTNIELHRENELNELKDRNQYLSTLPSAAIKNRANSSREAFKQEALGRYSERTNTQENNQCKTTRIKILSSTKKPVEKEQHLFETYTIKSLLGHGGFSSVYLVEKDGKEYAMKVPKGINLKEYETVFLKEEDKEAYENEVCIWKDLSDNIPDAVLRLIEADTTPFPWFVMERAHGTLHEAMKNMPLTMKLNVFIDLLKKLEYIHKMGVIHKDIKPQNILLVEGLWKFTDFGLSKTVGKSSRSGQTTGTPGFMAPEQVSPGRKFGHSTVQTDIWSMGVILYYMLANRLPFEGSTYEQIGMNILFKEPEPPSFYHLGLPKELDVIVMKALAKEQGERFQSAREMREELEKLVAAKFFNVKGSCDSYLHFPSPVPQTSGTRVFLLSHRSLSLCV